MPSEEERKNLGIDVQDREVRKRQVVPDSIDLRDDGIITPVKNQVGTFLAQMQVGYFGKGKCRKYMSLCGKEMQKTGTGH